MITESSGERKIEDIDELATLAKLPLNTLHPETQCIYFDANIWNSNGTDHTFKLMEVDKELLKALECERQVVIKKSEVENGLAVLCTKSKSYTMKDAETSNLLLLASDIYSPSVEENSTESSIRSKSVKCVRTSLHHYYELTPNKCFKEMSTLRNLLESDTSRLVDESDYENNRHEKGMSFDDLLTHIASSHEELEMALNQIKAVKLQGVDGRATRWYLLDPHYQTKLIKLLVECATSTYDDVSRIKKDVCIDILKSLEVEELLSKVFDMYFTRSSSSTQDLSDCDEFTFNNDEISTYIAFSLFYATRCSNNTASCMFDLNDFVEMWKQVLPKGVHLDVDKQLLGLTCVDRSRNPNTVRYVDEASLPLNIEERLSMLFKMKVNWSLDELSPFVCRLTNERFKTPQSLLSSYARSYSDVETNQIMFGAKYS